MKSKVWSIIGIIVGIACFLLGILAFFISAITSKNGNLESVASTCVAMTIIGLVVGILSVVCCSKRTEWHTNVVAGFSNLAKIGLMMCIIVFFGVIANV